MLLALTMTAAVAVSVEPARLNLQAPPPAARVLVASSTGRAPKLWASSGELTAARALGGGRFEARYRPPASGAPGWAVVAAWDAESGEAGAATVELWARTELPVETEPGARLTVVTGSHKVNARADAQGHARVVTWVGPTVKRARITAEDAAGNTTVEEIVLDVPRPQALWLVADSPSRVLAFSVARVLPHVEAVGAELDVEAQPGIAVAQVRAYGEVTLTASTDAERTTLSLAAPSAAGAAAAGGPRDEKPRFADPRWELGASIGPRVSDAFTGAALTGEWRRRIRGTRWHLGVDLGGMYATGVAGDDVRLGGASLRGVAELRFSVGARVALLIGVQLGGVLVGERRTAVSGISRSAFDGGPALGGGAGLLARMGPGVLTVAVSGAWTPLLGLGRANLDGGMLSVGYRAARW